MRVALVAPRFPPEFLGGTERVVLALAQCLREAGDEVLVLAGSDRPHQGEDIERDEWQGIPVRRIPRHPDEVYGIEVRRPRVLALCEQVLREEAVEVLHLHHWAMLSDELLRAARRMGIGRVATLHDMWSTCPRFFRQPPPGIRCPERDERDSCVPCAQLALPHLDEVMLRGGLRARDAELRGEFAAASVITVPSEACRRRIAEHLPFDGELRVVPHGLLEPVDEHRDGPWSGGTLRIGMFGNLVEAKGVMLLVCASHQVPNLELHFHGPFLEAEFEERVKAKATELGVVLHCHGAYGPDDLHPAMQLDLAVFPSLCEETYGLVVEEAQVRGVPVVVSNRGALPERIGAGGIAVAVEDTGPLQQLLTELQADPARLRELTAGLPRSFRSMQDTAAEYRELYARAVQEASS